MKKLLVILWIVVLMLFCATSVSAKTIDSGTVGESAFWRFEDNGTLKFS